MKGFSLKFMRNKAIFDRWSHTLSDAQEKIFLFLKKIMYRTSHFYKSA